MISLGTATLIDRGQRYPVHAALTWHGETAWHGILGGRLDWESLSGRPLTLEVPPTLGPSADGIVTDVTVEAVLDNEVRASGARITRPVRRRLGVFTSR